MNWAEAESKRAEHKMAAKDHALLRMQQRRRKSNSTVPPNIDGHLQRPAAPPGGRSPARGGGVEWGSATGSTHPRPTALDLPPAAGSLDLPEFYQDMPESPVSPSTVASDNSSQLLGSEEMFDQQTQLKHRLLEPGFTQPIVSPPLPCCVQKRRRVESKKAVGVTGVRTSSCYMPSTVWRNARCDARHRQ